MVVVPLYLAIIGKSVDAIHSTGNGMVFWLLESPGNCTKDQSQSISMKFSGPLLDITTGMSYKIVHETWQILLYNFELLFYSKTFQMVQNRMEKISQTKLASSKATITSHWNKACKMKLSGLLGTQSYYWYISCDTEVDPNKAAWWWLCMEQQLRHCRQRTRSSQADWSRTASPTSAHCRHPDQRYCQEYFYKRTW